MSSASGSSSASSGSPLSFRKIALHSLSLLILIDRSRELYQGLSNGDLTQVLFSTISLGTGLFAWELASKVLEQNPEAPVPAQAAPAALAAPAADTAGRRKKRNGQPAATTEAPVVATPLPTRTNLQATISLKQAEEKARSTRNIQQLQKLIEHLRGLKSAWDRTSRSAPRPRVGRRRWRRPGTWRGPRGWACPQRHSAR